MIDLHMHTINSDGSDTVEELLKKCQDLELEYISITDHDTCKSYDELKNIDIKNIFKGKKYQVVSLQQFLKEES